MYNITKLQNNLLNELRSKDPGLSVEWDEMRGVAAFIRGTLAPLPDTTPDNVVKSFLTKYTLFIRTAKLREEA